MLHNIRLYTLKELTTDEVELLLDTVEFNIGIVPAEYYDENTESMALSHVSVYHQEDSWIYEMRTERMVTDEDAQSIITELSASLPMDFDIDASYDDIGACDTCQDEQYAS